MTLHPLLWSLAAGLLVATTEVLFRKADSWQLWWVVPAIAINYLLFRAFREAPSLLIGALIVTLSLVVLRSLASQFILGETVARGNLVAAVVLAVGAVVALLWR